MKRLLMALPLVFIVGCSGFATKTEGTKIKKESVWKEMGKKACFTNLPWTPKKTARIV